MKYLLLLSFSLLLSCGQILFKIAAGAGPSVWDVALSRSMWAALVLYAGATALWVWILRDTPLSQAYPFAALGFVVVPLAASQLFGEPIGPVYFVGAALIALGVVLTSSGLGR